MLSICLQLISKHDLGVVILSDSTEEVADSLCSILEEKNLDSDVGNAAVFRFHPHIPFKPHFSDDRLHAGKS